MTRCEAKVNWWYEQSENVWFIHPGNFNIIPNWKKFTVKLPHLYIARQTTEHPHFLPTCCIERHVYRKKTWDRVCPQRQSLRLFQHPGTIVWITRVLQEASVCQSNKNTVTVTSDLNDHGRHCAATNFLLFLWFTGGVKQQPATDYKKFPAKCNYGHSQLRQ
jgi:hypothetical protein